jgi:hypothetical protein
LLSGPSYFSTHVNDPALGITTVSPGRVEQISTRLLSGKFRSAEIDGTKDIQRRRREISADHRQREQFTAMLSVVRSRNK